LEWRSVAGRRFRQNLLVSKNPQCLPSLFALAAIALGDVSAYATEPPSQPQVQALSLTRCARMAASGVLRESAPVLCDRLRVVGIRYIDFEGRTRQGEIVVLDAVAENVKALFNTLYEKKFPLNKVAPMERYGGDDAASMADNNTSAFNARAVSGGSRWSLHAYGVAIDVNPRQNPYISFNTAGAAAVLPPSAQEVAFDRSTERVGAGRSEDVVELFAQHGFLRWGGDWKSPKDYQHFEVGTRAFAQRLAASTPAQAHRLFDDYTAAYRACMAQVAARAACVDKVMR
jgi:hypothetical protein